METKISKIQFRQDSASNWSSLNPVLASGEPAYELPTSGRPNGGYKIGDGVTAWNELPYSSIIGSELTDVVVPSENLYARQYLPGGTPQWVTFQLPVADTRKTFADLMEQAYDVELNMNYSQKQSDGTTRPVYGIRKRFIITATGDSIITNTITTAAYSIVGYGGTIKADEDEVYALPCTSTVGTNFNVKVYIDETDAPDTISVSSVSNIARTNAPLDL